MQEKEYNDEQKELFKWDADVIRKRNMKDVITMFFSCFHSHARLDPQVGSPGESRLCQWLSTRPIHRDAAAASRTDQLVSLL